MMAKSVYIHIPFCKSICTYCDFCKFLYNEKWVVAYFMALEKEINDRYMDDEIETIYIGGGTPSVLNNKELIKLFMMVDKIRKADDYEFTFECNLGDINEELLFILKYYGVNRLSIGIESFQENNLKFMERTADFKDAFEKIKLCRQKGFNNINLDLMYAIPGETMKDLKKDLDFFIKLSPEHISAYSLILENHTKAYVNNAQNIDEELDYEMFKMIEKKLSNAHHYEISNYALRGYESRHNLVYWNNLEYYGFGLGAAGYIDGIRYENTKNLKEYLLGNYVASKEILSKDEQMKYEIMLGLRKIDGINMNDFFNKYQIKIEEAFPVIKNLVKNKDLIRKKEYIFINPDKIYVMNEILLKII